MIKRAYRANSALLAMSALAVVVILVLGWALLHVSDTASRSQSMAHRTEQVLRTISSLRESLALAESGQRGFLLTGDAKFLQTREESLQELQQQGASLRDDVADSPVERDRSQRLGTLIEERIALMRTNERIRTTQGIVAASRAVSDQLPGKASEHINDLLDEMAEQEALALATHQQNERQGQQSLRSMLEIAGLMVLAIMPPLLWWIGRQSRTRRQAESRLQAILHNLPGALYLLRMTPEGALAYDFLSTNAADVLGVSREQVLRDARIAHKLVIREDSGRLSTAFARSVRDHSEIAVDFRIRKPGGEIRWLRSSAIPARDENGDLVWSGYWLDITEIKGTEQTLHHAMQRLEDAHNVAGLGDWTCDLATGAVTWSPQIYAMLQREPSQGTPNLAEAAALFENGTELTADAFFKAQESGEPQAYEMTARLANGQVAALNVIAVPTLNEAREVVGMHGTIQDITARKALEERLSQAKEASDAANRAKSDFLAMMSHEIRTPLNGMLGLIELISLMPQQQELRPALDGVRESGKSLQRIIDDILDYSKVEAGKLEIRLEPTRIGDVMSALQRVHGAIASSHGLELHHSVDPRISPVVLVDGLRLRQILSNFISNAIKFTPSGRIDLRVALVDRNGDRERLRFEVVDTGIGISPARQRRLFQPFEQAEESSATRSGGTGLGLSISKRLAELMGGNVSMSSELGQGTTMLLDLPVVVTDRQPAGAAEEVNPAPAVKPPLGTAVAATKQAAVDAALVLVVDDHPINRMLMCRQLNTLGYAAEDVESGAEALDAWASGRFALVLTDCNMPGMSGYELSRHIRGAEAARGGGRVPIIACSANVMGKVQKDCMDAGMDDYISKPTDLARLTEKMRRWLPLPAGPAGGQPSTGRLHEAAEPAQGPGIEPQPPSRVSQGPKGEPAISPRVIERFRRVNDADAEQLLQAFEQRDMTSITHLAHRIKGACGFIGATGLASVCSMVEHAGRTDDASAIDWLMETFRSELEQLNAHLDAE